MESYNSREGAQQYIDFINSQSGKFEQDILPKFILQALGEDKSLNLLDAGCGTGWLTKELSKNFTVQGCDASSILINYAKKTYPDIKYNVVDVTAPNLPFTSDSFDAVVANLSLHDMADVPQALKNLCQIIKPKGKLIITISNPYYSLPVGIWKRGFLKKLFGHKPMLRLRPYFSFKKTDRAFKWGKNLNSHFYTLPEYINWALAAGFTLSKLTDIQASLDSPDFNLQYQMFRYPYILMLEFLKL